MSTVGFNPFAAMRQPPPVDPAVVIPATAPDPPPEVARRLEDFTALVSSAGPLFYDFETIPNDERYPRPVKPGEREPEPEPLTAEVIKGEPLFEWLKAHSVNDIDSALLSVLRTPEDLAKIREAEVAGKNRKGVLELIDKNPEFLPPEWRAWMDADHKWRNLAKNPFTARPVSFSFAIGSSELTNVLARDREAELLMLRLYMLLTRPPRRRVGFNSLAYDDRLVVARSILLDLPAADRHKLSLQKFNNAEAIDLMNVLFPQGTTAMKFKDVAHALGLTPEAGDTDGSQVLDLWLAGEYDKVAFYNNSDVSLTREVYYLTCDLIG